jgi:hypothetical protein
MLLRRHGDAVGDDPVGGDPVGVTVTRSPLPTSEASTFLTTT